MTENITARLLRHNKGENKSTKAHRPWELFFSESFDTRVEARKREVYLKAGSGKEYIKKKWQECHD